MGKSKTESTSREKISGFFYVLLLFVSTSALCSFILFFSGSDYQFAKSKSAALAQMERVNGFKKIQDEYIDKIKTLNDDVNKMNPGLNASYEKRELNYSFGELKKVYSDNKYDDRFRIFDQTAQFLEMKLFDRERLFSVQKNIERFNTDLERCRNGIEGLAQ